MYNPEQWTKLVNLSEKVVNFITPLAREFTCYDVYNEFHLESHELIDEVLDMLHEEDIIECTSSCYDDFVATQTYQYIE